MKLLEKLCAVPAPAGNERPLRDFLLDHLQTHQHTWRVQPTVVADDSLQDCMIWVFGQPRTAIFAHMDSIGFTVRYDNHLVPIGGPETRNGDRLVGRDAQGPIETRLVTDGDGELLCVDFPRPIAPGTELTFRPHFRETADYVQCCYLDNRLGVWNALRVAETLTDGAICFSCWEEHGGGSVAYLVRYLYEQYQLRQALVSDITWVTEGVRPGRGVAISLRDRSIPRRAYLERILALAAQSGVDYQLEVEGSGGSDGKEIQASPYPIDWCFVGAAEQHVHSPDEKVHKRDIAAMTDMYRYLMAHL